MATAIKASVNNATDYFDLDGLDYEKGLYVFYYDSVEKDTSGVIDESKIRIGLRSKHEIGRNLVQPKLVINWTDGGVVASGTITASTVLENTFATGAVTCASALAADTVTANGLLYTAVSGAKANNTEFSIDTGDDETATDLADSIDNDTRLGTTGDLSATSTSAVVTMTTDVAGTAGNAITLISSNGSRLAVTGSGFLTGGVSADTVTVNGLLYTAVAGVKADNTQFSTDTGNDETATDLADSISKDIRVGTLNDVRAVSASAVVTVSSKVPGTGGNSITLVTSDAGTLAISGALFTGGINEVAFSDFDTFIAAASILISE